MKNAKGFIATVIMFGALANTQALIIGIDAGNNGTHDELSWTLNQLGHTVVDDGFNNVDVFIAASGNWSSYNLQNSVNNGIGFIQIGDWGPDWTNNRWHYDAVGPYTLSLDNNHAITTGLDQQWSEYGFHNNNSSWNPGDSPKGYVGWDTNLGHDSIVSSISVYSVNRVVTAEVMNGYNAVYIGVEAYGHRANENSLMLLDNAIQWTATGQVARAAVPEPSTLALLAIGLLGFGFIRKSSRI